TINYTVIDIYLKHHLFCLRQHETARRKSAVAAAGRGAEACQGQLPELCSTRCPSAGHILAQGVTSGAGSRPREISPALLRRTRAHSLFQDEYAVVEWVENDAAPSPAKFYLHSRQDWEQCTTDGSHIGIQEKRSRHYIKFGCPSDSEETRGKDSQPGATKHPNPISLKIVGRNVSVNAIGPAGECYSQEEWKHTTEKAVYSVSPVPHEETAAIADLHSAEKVIMVMLQLHLSGEHENDLPYTMKFDKVSLYRNEIVKAPGVPGPLGKQLGAQSSPGTEMQQGQGDAQHRSRAGVGTLTSDRDRDSDTLETYKASEKPQQCCGPSKGIRSNGMYWSNDRIKKLGSPNMPCIGLKSVSTTAC
ncbi:hypothetical protein EK904_003320, partial [Melospiza melodia maxima]